MKFAENDYRALKNVVNASGKPVHIQIYPINPVEPKSPTAKETESQSPFRPFGVKTEVWQSMTEAQRTKLVTQFAEHSITKARAALEDAGNPNNSAILLAYCGSFQRPDLR